MANKTNSTSSQLHRIASKTKRLLKKILREEIHPIKGSFDMLRLGVTYHRTVFAIAKAFMTQPGTTGKMLGEAIKQHARLIKNLSKPPTISDKRFANALWQDKRLFHFIHQSYLIHCQTILQAISELKGMDNFTQQQGYFFVRILLETLSPSNFVLTNPEVLQLTRHERGKNLLTGLEHWLDDLNQWSAYGHVSKVMNNHYLVGDNIAYTPGEVIFENTIMQLIQYHPTTPQVYAKPLLLVGSWINKYYLMDLRANNSLVKYLVDQGYTVFMISWVNATSEQQSYGFADYVTEGVVKAIDEVCAACNVKQINIAGNCLGGTLVGASLAYLTATNQADKIHCASFLASLFDFSEAGDWLYLAGPDQVRWYQKTMAKTGYFDGRKMLTAFNLRNTNDTIWPFFIHHYLKGKRASRFDLLHWSEDVTHIPQKLFLFHMRELLQHNQLYQAGGIDITAKPIDLRCIQQPCYYLGLKDDDLSPWQGSYRSAQLLRGNTRFVLGNGDHIGGFINPPRRKQLGFYVNNDIQLDASTWLKHAEHHPGSWWEDWQTWLNQHSGKPVTPRQILTSIEPAPGRYSQRTIHN
ncbi:MAG: class I poly(R)-hydroxyalkanoic acid synthase [Legionellales bacterium]|nr:class I poly(R)-hydroxyalkanoic acid synthase [Legionellales bacterium]|tara:strand:+ start:17276 stop:19015 length:1740 start_codon:yes stop_codon:yes gene_type:complete